MSCWVAPSIAAEMWGVSVEEILRRARTGELSGRDQHGFFLVDIQPAKTSPPHTPETYVPLAAGELAALSGEGADGPAPPTPQQPPADEDSAGIEEWREVRKRMGRLRIPPRPQTPPPQARAA